MWFTMLTFLYDNAVTIILALAGVLVTFATQRYIARCAAAKAFRETIIDTLGDLYPSPGNWLRGFEAKLGTVLKSLSPAVAKYKYHLTRGGARRLENAWQEFANYASQVTWEKCAGYAMYDTMREPNEASPQDVFYDYLDALLGTGKMT